VVTTGKVFETVLSNFLQQQSSRRALSGGKK